MMHALGQLCDGGSQLTKTLVFNEVAGQVQGHQRAQWVGRHGLGKLGSKFPTGSNTGDMEFLKAGRSNTINDSVVLKFAMRV